MDCDICCEEINQEERVPKMAPCGHSVCLTCLQSCARMECPTCRGVQDYAPERPLAADGPRRPTGQDPPPAGPDPPPGTQPVLREMDMRLVNSGGNEQQHEKAAALRDAPGVGRLVFVQCERDPAWSLQLLQLAAPTVERLSVVFPCEAHLLVMHAMPRLRRLHVSCDVGVLSAQPLGALPPGHAGLQWLRVWSLPRATLRSLLRAHGHTLEELMLGVGTPGEDEWPMSCSDLHSLLQKCGLRALRRLVLRRWECSQAACSQQRAEVRRVLPGVEVQCEECDGVVVEEV